ncbi:hypothetical protein WA026_013730 [Henosepilachna vigintioctopunctata]|uniref:Tyrosine-protein kinase receptor n=1 Tax=Henosepilachna vigintioctopunctata TaxID=420089 RepID=A0AAW1UQV0_9CUCU
MAKISNLLLLVLHLLSSEYVRCGCEFSKENTKYSCKFRTFEEDESADGGDEINGRVRFKRKASDRSISNLKKRLNDERIREELMAANSTPKLVMNDFLPPEKILDDQTYGGVFTREQKNNKKDDKIRQVHKQQHNTQVDYPAVSDTDCNFEEDCLWTWRKDIANGFFITSSKIYNTGENGPQNDANGKDGGSFLLLKSPHSETEFQVTSPLFTSTKPSCRLQVWIYQVNMEKAEIRVVIDKLTKHSSSINNHTQWVLDHIPGNNERRWKRYVVTIGKVSENFTILLEVIPAKDHSSNSTLAFDNVALLNCYPRNDDTCTAPLQFRCTSNTNCINSTKVCDITEDCNEGEDERQSCDQMPYGARCSFEEDMCGWYNDNKLLEWSRHNGPTPTNFTGPSWDHTYMNSSGKYLFVNMLKDKVGFASRARLRSMIFNPPPTVHGNVSSKYYNSCAIRFYLHQTGKHKSALSLHVTELKPNYNESKDIFWSYFDHGDRWVRQVLILPNITHRYFLNFDAKRGLRYISDIAIDDVSLSPECFGLNIPQSELGGYNYWDPIGNHLYGREPHKEFANKSHYQITSCGATGRFGPTPSDCVRAYNRTKVKVTVLHDSGLSGMQRWIVPSDGYYSLLTFGASGGKGSGAIGSSRGAMVRTVVHLKRGQELIFLIGQEGSSACEKTLQHQENTSCWSHNQDIPKGIRGVLSMNINDGGGGGGGATYVFMRNRTRHAIPIAIAAGGGGLGLGRFIDTGRQHGQAINTSKVPVPGTMYGRKSSGAGGGWRAHVGVLEAAYVQIMGGGGYAGGDASTGNSTNGGGGYSYLDPSRSIPHLLDAVSGYNAGPGYVLITPAISGCGCDYRCVALDSRRSQVACICPYGWKLDVDGKICIQVSGFSSGTNYPTWFVIGLILTVICLTVAFAIFCFMLYNRYQIRASGKLRRKMLANTDVQLNRLGVTSNTMMTEYNPNYEFGGHIYTSNDLKVIPKAQLRLEGNLGHGAFGVVREGFYKDKLSDELELPVAVKTLAEKSSPQAEKDFKMEAIIMSKFNHPNIVHFLGIVLEDRRPKCIVLELLPGGDLKDFLRESRPTPEKGVTLEMIDLIMIAIDVAKGCRYLEENRFIHRDLAARNCLLTTRGPGRVVKIADFGMSRDIYRSDYYRRGGKSMVPVKWMPPESFMDGIYSSKTDVWSFGVLLWEIMSMGYMPYTGCSNSDVINLIMRGGRLEAPVNCPGPIYGIMKKCWDPNPEERPSFARLVERLGYCSQDPEVITTPLPMFYYRYVGSKDNTLMRPSDSDEDCLEILQSSDYLIPNHSEESNLAECTSSVEKLLPDHSNSYETSFIMPNSKSCQPLLTENEPKDEDSLPIYVDRSLKVNHQADPKISPVSLPSNIHSNLNNNIKNETPSLKSGISLDVGALIKDSSEKPKYANMSNTNGVAGKTTILRV